MPSQPCLLTYHTRACMHAFRACSHRSKCPANLACLPCNCHVCYEASSREETNPTQQLPRHKLHNTARAEACWLKACEQQTVHPAMCTSGAATHCCLLGEVRVPAQHTQVRCLQPRVVHQLKSCAAGIMQLAGRLAGQPIGRGTGVRLCRGPLLPFAGGGESGGAGSSGRGLRMMADRVCRFAIAASGPLRCPCKVARSMMVQGVRP